MNWKHVSLGEISVNIQTGPFGSQLHQSDYSEKGTPVVMPKDLISGHISEESIARVSDDHVERLSRHKIEVGDILYSRRGDVGRCAFASETEAGWLCGTGCLRVTIDSRKANPKFVFYQLLKADTIGWVEKHAVGSTMLNLNTSILSSVPIDLPSHDKQNHILERWPAFSKFNFHANTTDAKAVWIFDSLQKSRDALLSGKRIVKGHTAHIRQGLGSHRANVNASHLFKFLCS